MEIWKSQFTTFNNGKMELRILPFVNIEHEVLMLSSILNSNGAIQMNIQIMKIFIKMREMVLANKDLFTKIE